MVWAEGKVRCWTGHRPEVEVMGSDELLDSGCEEKGWEGDGEVGLGRD